MTRRAEVDDRLAIDHLVLCVPDLDRARDAWGALGFTVSPRGHHSDVLGTSNHTIMFERDYVELLGVRIETAANAVYRAMNAAGGGVSSLAVTAREGATVSRALAARGFGPGEPLAFSRDVPTPGGGSARARFEITSWPAEHRPAGVTLFACRHLTPEHVWLPELLAHSNGATGIEAIAFVAPDPDAAAGEIAASLGGRVATEGDAVIVEAGGRRRARLVFRSVDRWAMLHGARPEAMGRGARVAGLVLRTLDLGAAARATGIAPIDGRVIVPAERANGLVVTFLEMSPPRP